MQTITQKLLTAMGSGIPPVLVSIISREGSVPRTAGARMLVLADGSIAGTIGGGKYEAEAIKESVQMQQAYAQNAGQAILAKSLGFSLRGVSDMDMICGGELFLLLELMPDSNATRELFTAACAAEIKGESFIYITRLTGSGLNGAVNENYVSATSNAVDNDSSLKVSRFILFPKDNKLLGTAGASNQAKLPDGILEAATRLKQTVPQLVSGSEGSFLLELCKKPFVIHLFGGGHVAKALAELLDFLDFRLQVIEDRPEFATAARFKNAACLVLPALSAENVADCLAVENIDEQHGIIIMTRGHAFDRDVLTAALAFPAGYLGMIGSRSKWGQIKKTLAQSGVPLEKLEAVHCPIGLAIQAETPEEIAVSIAAELVLWRNSLQ